MVAGRRRPESDFANDPSADIIQSTGCGYCHAEVGERCYKNHRSGPFYWAQGCHLARIQAYHGVLAQREQGKVPWGGVLRRTLCQRCEGK